MMQTTSNEPGGGMADRFGVPGQEGMPAPGTMLRKVLLVDDEADGAEFAAILLRSHGLTVTVVHSASEALQALQADNQINAVLTDVMMPGTTGLQLAETIREMYPAVKIVLMSGYVLPELLKDRALDYLFVAKPYRIDAMLKVLCS